MPAKSTTFLSPEYKTNVKRALKQMKRDWLLYVMFIPVALNFIVFHFWPMYGLRIAFMDYNPVLGFDYSRFVGLKNFERFFSSQYFGLTLRNTLSVTLSSLLLSPLPIILALLLNEVTNARFKKTIQTISYMPHFVSAVIVVGILNILFSNEGIVNNLIQALGYNSFNFLSNKNTFLPMYLGMGVWGETGYESIIFIAAITNINPELYEAAEIDGAGRMKRLWHVTLPEILSTLVVIYIMRIGNIMNVGWQTIYLMQNELNLETSEVISTFVYKRGLIDSDYGYSTAVGLFNNLIGFILVLIANKLSKVFTESSLF